MHFKSCIYFHCNLLLKPQTTIKLTAIVTGIQVKFNRSIICTKLFHYIKGP